LREPQDQRQEPTCKHSQFSSFSLIVVFNMGVALWQLIYGQVVTMKVMNLLQVDLGLVSNE